MEPTTTDAIITTNDLVAAQTQLSTDGLPKTMDTLRQTEPVLFGFLLTAAQCVAGRLALGKAPSYMVRQTADELLELALTCVIALGASHARLWEQHMDDTPPAAGKDNNVGDLPF
jgi:hypothetical protein